MTEPDRATLRGLRHGDEAACRVIYDRYKSRVYTLSMRICQDEGIAMDILQDSFIQAFARIDQFHGERFWPWLRRIAVNRCLDQLRRERRRPVLVALAEEQPDRPLEQGLDLDLASAFKRLPAQARAVVWLYDVEGYSHQEIARMFDRSTSFSKTQLSRAHSALRSWLGHEERPTPCPDPNPCQA